ncbi:acyl-coenzyme A thioesterase PaaI-like protein [Actinomycetospora succinea]|uniref:Acyl-coenzyme A thioesterase PaaI-like protein n=1 Tax=Actinomycetospora succinea TaxID=663603 RepID=A0A4R6VS45_9PSEU|nr:PaaI family thioesterase [Actinomycetospora succinea]TDQ62710.1 acyl-coenzyme A thioesterase PaaI-like protein [Actinomycetospora succinea]
MTGLLTGDDLLARAEAALAVALPDALGVEFVDPYAPLDGVVLPVTGIAVTPAATAHASALGAAIELAGYLAVLPTLTPAQHAVTHQISTQYLRPAASGTRVRVVGTLAKRARELAFVSVTASLEDGPDRPVALSQITKSIVGAT